jgi:hypothetical protein
MVEERAADRGLDRVGCSARAGRPRRRNPGVARCGRCRQRAAMQVGENAEQPQ